jgi:hypothetical protein
MRLEKWRPDMTLPLEPLYGRTGFPQVVQGKTGEYPGESRSIAKALFFI